jgi:hypothetical protein
MRAKVTPRPSRGRNGDDLDVCSRKAARCASPLEFLQDGRHHPPPMRHRLLLTTVVLLTLPASASARTVQFSGHTWEVRANATASGPGPNVFSGSTKSVWVDRNGALHLKIRKEKGRWVCAEVFSQEQLGRGTYIWNVGSTVSGFDPRVVLGLFSYLNDSSEIDVEVARWDNTFDPTNAGFTVQPYFNDGNTWRFTTPSGPTSYGFDWGASTIDFSGPAGPWSYSGPDVPAFAGHRAHMNLWLFQGKPPRNGAEVEVVLRSFTFVPAA